jgi:PKD repeat protein
VIISIHDAAHSPVSGATVSGTWSNGANGTAQCTTGPSGGTCFVSYSGLLAKVPSVDFTVDHVSHDTLTYLQSDNHDADGNSDGTTITVYLEVPANLPPVASFTPDCTDLTCTFDASGSSDPDGSIASYAWTFGDGDSDTGDLVSHTYPAADNYSVTLTVTDNGGAQATDTQTVSVGGATAPTMHVGFLEGISEQGRRDRWNATAIITIHDTTHAPIPNATVAGTWSDGVTGSAECITDNSGQCSLAKSNLKATVTSVRFTVTGVIHATLGYAPEENHDPPGILPNVTMSWP